MIRYHRYIAIPFTVVLCLGYACRNDFSEGSQKTKSNQLNEAGVNTLLTGAYAMLNGGSDQSSFDSWDGISTNWLWGSVRGLEANNGSQSQEQADMIAIQTFTENASNGRLNDKWRMLYEGISRCNSTIVKAGAVLQTGGISKDTHDNIVKQARALRGLFHFEAWKMWKNMPYVDETTDPSMITNTADIRDKIINDLEAGVTLPDSTGQPDRFNGTICRVLLAKALMQMNHNYSDALILLLDVERIGRKPDGSVIGLAQTYGEIFDSEKINSIESLYTIKYTLNVSSAEAGYCGYFVPNQEFVNTFRTEDGLPLSRYKYNLYPVYNDYAIPSANPWSAGKKYDLNDIVTVTDPKEPAYRNQKAYKSIVSGNTGNNPLSSPAKWALAWQEDPGPLDPRIDWTVGRRGIPFWDYGIHQGSDWNREQGYSGPYCSKKHVVKRTLAEGLGKSGNKSNKPLAGYHLLRYADVLLLIAECYIEKPGVTASDLDEARSYINRVRHRAANPAGFVKETAGEITANAANYAISMYNEAFTSVDEARYALRIERKLELGLEGHRYFDLNRWGIATIELNRILAYQKTLPWGPVLYGNAIVKNEDLIYPIPQRQIDLSNGAIKQNQETLPR